VHLPRLDQLDVPMLDRDMWMLHCGCNLLGADITARNS
jgi:hypothetical protein